ncbi:MAG: SDR family oxidoreductase [Deltaproteobacteria bacterium]|nr:SDR family oxidoreductase [Deltaproteobacteria bacterium]
MSATASGDLRGRTMVVTGANSGIGKACATELARRGAHVVMTARDPQRGQAALDDVRRASGSADVELLLGDFASLADVRALASRIGALPKLDVLVNNAGLMLTERTETRDGFETTFQVNHLAPFLLTSLLAGKLAQTPGARVVTVSSDAHGSGGALDFDDLQSRRRYAPFGVYGRSKLCNILFTRELARRLEGVGVTANCLHPGVVATGFAGDGDATGWFAWGVKLARPFMITPEKGADTMVYLASSPDVANVTGRYFVKRREKMPGRHARDDAAARRLWDESARMTGAPAVG